MKEEAIRRWWQFQIPLWPEYIAGMWAHIQCTRYILLGRIQYVDPRWDNTK
jgi:hypothetical protein